MDVAAGDDDVASGSVPDEQPERITKPAAAAHTARSGCLRIPPIYATLAAMNDGTRFLECCQA
ncbi:hypothetical protein HLY00_2148 [Mycolicibacterium hippocampi]|uniref:Uncharacterized protein n=1 Tax=Mycolicibacterium hippocampi TaxID=659824 RepID=A0A850PV93_9MYCO|nr:hypothetical protein [Mycolicibacterium hippocampi]